MAESDSTSEAKPLPKLGSYLLTRQLGSGGMSNVFRAIHDGSGSIVALKVLPRTLAKNATLLQRFIKEAKSAEALDHPNIVAIYDRGFDQGRHYLVLEFVEGRDLHDRIRLNGPMAPADAIKLIREVSEGLRYAAGKGMIHRDVKPANLLIDSEGRAKIIDLGLALQTEDEDERVTRDGTTVGTVDYMAPEQARDSRKTSERSDIYSLGCTFYYLLTGSAPYPGGGLAEKLAKHYNGPVPDVRAVRPELDPALSALIARMMAKKPENRFDDYTSLIFALDAVAIPAQSGSRAITMDALIVDDDEDEGEISLAPIDAQGPRKEEPNREVAAATTPFLMAEIVDDEDEGDDVAKLPSRTGLNRSRPNAQPTTELLVSLGDLASLDGDEEPKPNAARRSSSSIRPASKPVTPTFADLVDEDDEDVVGVVKGARRAGGDELSIKTWIAAAVMIGLGIALVGVGLSFLMSFAGPAPTEAPPGGQPVVVQTEDAGPSGPAAPPRPAAPRPTPPPRTTAKKPGPMASIPSPVAQPVVPVDEKDYPSSVQASLVPVWSSLEVSPTARVEKVRRVPGTDEDPSVPYLAAAFGRGAEVVEIADTGPFFEDDFHLPGKTRVVRGRGALRPIIKVELPTQQAVKEQEAKFVLGGSGLERLVLEGLDLVVDLRDLPVQQTSLFLCRGAELTLRDCTLTIYNGGDRKVSIFRLAPGPRPNRVIVERSTLRGPIRTLAEVASPGAEILIDRSLIVGGDGPLISLEPAEKPARSIHLNRSLLTTRGPLIDWSYGIPSAVKVKALGSTIARVAGSETSALMRSRPVYSGDLGSLVGWAAWDVTLVGWPALVTAGPESSILAANLRSFAQAAPGSEPTGREIPSAWPDSAIRDEVTPPDFVPMATWLAPTLTRIARPNPSLRELTVDLARRPSLVKLAVNPAGNHPSPKLGAKPSSPVEVVFDMIAPTWNGDLGLFLAATVKEPGSRLVVRVRGATNTASPMTPVRLPDGCSVAIVGEVVGGIKGTMPTFSPADTTPGRSLIEVQGGDLTLADLAFVGDGSRRPDHWVLARGGVLAIRHCRFRDPGLADPRVGAIIAFEAAGVDPMAPVGGPLIQATDRPSAILKDCLIWAGGDGVSAELARGLVQLENSLVIAGGAAITLRPLEAASDRFEADLVLERCTIADEKSGIVLRASPGARTPDRPWLITTRSCIFPKTQRDTSGGLLEVDPETFARGNLFWQSFGDAYEVGRFLAASGPQPSAGPAAADLKRHWVDLWGSEHTRGDRGPDPRHNDRVVRYKDKDHPKPGRSFPLVFELDPKLPASKDLGVNFRELPAPPAR